MSSLNVPIIKEQYKSHCLTNVIVISDSYNLRRAINDRFVSGAITVFIMSEVITLSSEDEEEPVPVPKKRIKLTTLSTKVDGNIQEDPCIVVLDDDDDDCKEVNMESEPILEKSQTEKLEENTSCNGVCIPDNTKDAVVENGASSVSAGNTDVNNLSNSTVESETPPKADNTECKLFVFLNDCVLALKNSEHKSVVESKLPIIKKLYEKLKKRNQDLDGLSEFIQNNTEKVKNNPRETIMYFFDVFQWLKSSYKDASKAQKSVEHHQKIIKKLEKALFKIRKKIRELEEAEINFDEEENSAYIQMERYMARASQIYNKLCKYQDVNPHSGCIRYCRLDFSSSNFSEINRAINKKYKSNDLFPNYEDIDKCIRKCVQANNIKVSEANLKFEIKHCFEELGKLLQRRRKMDLYNNQRSYIENTTDPAQDNPEIVQKLNANLIVGNKRLDEVMEKFSQLQEKGVNPEVSPDSEDSDVAESGSECEQNENVTENI